MSLPRPYYEDASATLYHADCRELLPALAPDSVDCILTDPPYGVRWESHLRRVLPAFGAIVGDDGTLDLLACLRLTLPALRHHRHCYVFGLQSFGDLPLTGTTELIWDKGILGPGNLSLPWGPAHERILFGCFVPSTVGRANGQGKLTARLRRGSVLRGDRANSMGVTNHPTEKPVAILRQMIESSTLWGETVLDPFAGSGSTGVAAKLEGRRAILIEIEEHYCAVAARRLAQQVLPMEIVP